MFFKSVNRILLFVIAIGFLFLLAMVLHTPLRAQPASAPLLVITPDSLCGVRATGRDPLSFLVIEREAAGQRVNAQGMWVACDRPCIGTQDFRVWAEGPAGCTSRVPGDADPASAARDRTLLHGQAGYWQQQIGPTRGQLIEQCRDGTRHVLVSKCSPATHCSTEFAFERDAVVYRYDARRGPVPIGETVAARGPGDKSWPLSCVAGDWQFPLTVSKPVAPASAPARPAGCGRQTFLAGKTYWRYSGERVAEGSTVSVEAVLGGAGTAIARCGAGGKLAIG